eukprot:235906-Hanusia_phi.AAC.4
MILKDWETCAGELPTQNFTETTRPQATAAGLVRCAPPAGGARHRLRPGAPSHCQCGAAECPGPPGRPVARARPGLASPARPAGLSQYTE